MYRLKRTAFSKISVSLMLTLGVVLMIISAFYGSSFSAIFGTVMILWGAILLYVTPVRHVPLALLDASANGNTNNIERILSQFNLSEKGVYLPPKNLKNPKSSLIFVPKASEAFLPLTEEITEKVYSEQKEGAFLTPPGLGLSQLFEKGLNMSFTEIAFKHLQLVLPKTLVEDLELAENVEIYREEDIVTIEITGSVLNGICEQTNSQPRTHAQVGCLLASALACVLAKATGKPISIRNETVDQKTKITKIDYNIME